MGRKPRSCGLDFPAAANISHAINTATDCGFGFVCIPLAHPNLRRCANDQSVPVEKSKWMRTDLVLGANDWQVRVIPRVSSWLDLDSPNEGFRKRSEEVFHQELAYAHHLGIKGVLMDLRRRQNNNLARHLLSKLSSETSSYFRDEVWLQIPTSSRKIAASSCRNDVPEDDDEDKDDPWHWWDDLRLLCASNMRLKVALEVTADLPSEEKLSRWFGEPIEVLVVPTALFMTNKAGYPTLSKAHQRFIQKCAAREMTVLVTGGNRHASLRHYVQYINHLFQSAELPPHIQCNLGFEDNLQVPLQPLADHLESFTYETFEKDPVKYTEYGNAVYEALIDRVPESEKETNTQVVMVVGAGRGPLVTQTIHAARKANRKIRVYAVEKNPNAVVTLLDLKKVDWGDIVMVVHCDMRKWKAPEKCDILVSELLGSFGDNELSPECLDGAQVFLKDDGISIPESYRSYVQPIMSMRLYNETRELKICDKPYYYKFEQTYVVAQTNSYWIAPRQQLFEFIHPNRNEVIDNTRFKKLKFIASEDSTLYGFTGYFDTTLYKDVMLSIVPDTYSRGMFSWFPLYIPIMEPISLKKGDPIELLFWRRRDETKVWYEWCVQRPTTTGIHNINGRSGTIGL
ncbi:hypothetical protein GE061_004814 [Apolygus lucorum]|uniref:Protein arginine N-methyltransferase n=1 Tax=Apolygus lucorum TaxID=248454 RepID=A0A8S9X499_APOLU|nr:hypothetical protein GE061_004814 [Apolygus lucorum]